MLTVKFMKYDRSHSDVPNPLEEILIREATAVHVRREKDGRKVVQCGDAPGETFDITVGEDMCAYNVAYVMNDLGRTVETIA